MESHNVIIWTSEFADFEEDSNARVREYPKETQRSSQTEHSKGPAKGAQEGNLKEQLRSST